MRLQRQALWLWYRGGGFHGFQWQKDGRSVQQALEEALLPLGVTTRPMPAGRTDRGVSARMQVVMVKTPPTLSVDVIAARVNEALGEGGGVVMIRGASDGFQPQWSATGKEYRYRIWPRGPGSCSGAPAQSWAIAVPEVARLRETIGELRRTADFSAFHAASSTRRERTIERADVVERPDGLVEVQLVGDSFARYQVRLLVGTAVKVAAGELSRDAWRAAICHQQKIDGVRAPSDGLVLWSVRYPEGMDPFTAAERERAEGVPASAPFN